MSIKETGDKGKRSEHLEKGEEFLEMFRKGQEFTQDLLKENERLRFQVVHLEEEMKKRLETPDSAQANSLSQDMVEKLAQYEMRLEDLKSKLTEVEAENIDFAQRYIDVEEQNNNLANLYVASFQLHSTLEYKEVLQIILEIIINLIGGEAFAIYLLDEKTKTLNPEASEGVLFSEIPHVLLGEGVIGKAVMANESYFNESPSEELKELYEDPLVCIPLTIQDDVIGTIVLFRLLQQKVTFAPVDFELFTLLAGHAATAIFSSRLFTESKRKLSTYQGFLDLLSQ
ncbi:MAG: GAF domain-containing protein [bacterium]|nr:GAF domain-containing protein [bacterium]MDT8366364.1 GAF domain-containing protein [bacterium]